MKLSKTYKNCKGCKSIVCYTYVNNKRIIECAYTHAGTGYLSGCPCHECIIKMICNSVCGVLRDFVNDNNDSPKKLQVGEFKTHAVF